jgi:glucose-6-phosphate dehydrogenase assembly protein OpcA
MIFLSKQIQVPETLDVELVERELTALWMQTARGLGVGQEGAVWRARAANIIIFSSRTSTLDNVDAILADLSQMHPCRALIVLADSAGADQDIEIYIASLCQKDERGYASNLCCEEVRLRAAGQFVPELPSATLPLLVPDLPVFLWWDDELGANNNLWTELSSAADRLIVDSLNFPLAELQRVAQRFSRNTNDSLGISDINWARLTSWRALLASFYDVRAYRPALDSLQSINVDYVAPEATKGLAPQALLIAGWLASRLGWAPDPESYEQQDKVLRLKLRKKDLSVELVLRGIAEEPTWPGRLSCVELKSNNDSATFCVSRSTTGVHLETHTNVNGDDHPGQVMPVRNRSMAQLLGREMEILKNDDIYATALTAAMKICEKLR